MPSKNQFTGMTGLYRVAAELSHRGFIVSPTSRSVLTADLLVADPPCKNVYAVQVKTNAVTFSFWLVNKNTSRIVSDHLIYALINLRKAGPEYFLVPSKVVARMVKYSPSTATRKSVWYSVYLHDVAEFKGRWEVFKKEDLAPEVLTVGKQ